MTDQIPVPVGRTVTLRHEVNGADTRNLWAFIDQGLAH